MAIFQVSDYTIQIEQGVGNRVIPKIRIGLYGGGDVNILYLDDENPHNPIVNVLNGVPRLFTVCRTESYPHHRDLLRNESPLAVVIGSSADEPASTTDQATWSLVALIEPPGEGDNDETGVLFNQGVPIPESLAEFLFNTYQPY